MLHSISKICLLGSFVHCIDKPRELNSFFQLIKVMYKDQNLRKILIYLFLWLLFHKTNSALNQCICIVLLGFACHCLDVLPHWHMGTQHMSSHAASHLCFTALLLLGSLLVFHNLPFFFISSFYSPDTFGIFFLSPSASLILQPAWLHFWIIDIYR